MKGQNAVINEILLFGISAAVVFSVAGVVSFATTTMNTQTQKEQYILVGDLASMSLTKAYLCGKFASCKIAAEIPQRLSGTRYSMELSQGNITVGNSETGESVSVRTPDFNTTAIGFVTGNGRFFTAASRNNVLLLTR